MEQIPTLDNMIDKQVNTMIHNDDDDIKTKTYAKSVFYEDRRSGKDRRTSEDLFATGPEGVERRSGRDQRLISTIQSF